MESVTSPAVAARPRAFVGVRGPQAADFLQRMVSNDVVALRAGESCDALLLTPKARVVAILRAVRRGPDDFLLLTETDLGETLRDHLLRARFASRVEVGLEQHESILVLGTIEPPEGSLVIASDDYGVPAFEIIDGVAPPGSESLDASELERLRIEAGTARFGFEVDDRVLPAEAGLVDRAVSFDKGCYPGQEPIARLHYRGHANRGLRVLRIEGTEPPARDVEIFHDGKVVGRITSAARAPGGAVALGYVRSEVPEDANLAVDGALAHIAPASTPTRSSPTP